MLKRLSRRLLLFALILSASFAAHAQVNCFTGTSCVTLTGFISGSNGATASNYTLSFTPTQTFYIAGTGVVINTTTSCATDTNGAVVGLANPNSLTTITPSYTGTLPAGNYYIQYTFYQTNGSIPYETLPSVEQQAQLSATGTLTVQAPAGGLPSLATGMRVYIGATSGSETLQGQTTGTSPYTQSVPLGTSTVPPNSNSSVCKQVANDAGWPTGTGYNVALTDSSGNTVPNYPMQWQLLGPNTTINLSNGLPYYHGTVIYPSPILATPQNHGQQSISGNLSLSGYALVNAIVNAIGGNSNFQILNGVFNAALYPVPRITNAVAAASGTGGMVFIPCGTYTDNVTVSNVNGVRIVGENENCVFIEPANTTAPVFAYIAPTSWNELSDVQIYCPTSTTCNDGVQFNGDSFNDWMKMNRVLIWSGSGTAVAGQGFAHGINIAGRAIWDEFTNVEVAGNLVGLQIMGDSGAATNAISFTNFRAGGNYNYGVYINQSVGTQVPEGIGFFTANVELNGINTTLANCAGMYLNGSMQLVVQNTVFEDNCPGNTADATFADVRLTGTYNQAASFYSNTFNEASSEWGIYNDTVQTVGDYDGNRFTDTAHSIYISTSHSLSQLHIGTNFNTEPTIVADGNGWTHTDSAFPLGVDITVYNQSTITGITAETSSDIWLENTGSETISTIPGGHSGQLLILRQVGASGTTLTNNSGGTGSLELLNGGNRTLAAGQSALFINDGTNWQEISPGPSSSVTTQYLNAAMGGTCPSAASVGAACTSGTLTWPSAFIDTSYAVTCTVYNQTGLPTVSSVAITGTQTFTVTIAALTAIGVNGNVHCIATR